MNKPSIQISIKAISKNELDTNEELLQTGYWADFKEGFGWKAHPLKIDLNNEKINILFLTRQIHGNTTIAYVPLGPSIKNIPENPETIIKLISEKAKELLPKNTILIRYDLPWSEKGPGNIPEPIAIDKSLKKVSIYIQPLSTVILDITGTEEEILKRMKNKTRYNIRLAAKKGVKVIESGEEKLEKWYNIYSETSKRDKIAIHSYEYYNNLFKKSEEYGTGSPEYKLLLAEIEGETVAGIIVAFRGSMSWYLYGASSNKKRNFMPNHALQWKAIQIAKEKGCLKYDFCGIPTIEDKSHPMYGLYRFKTGFGGTIINRYGCYDYVCKKISYKAYRLAENLRNFYFKVIKKRF